MKQVLLLFLVSLVSVFASGQTPTFPLEMDVQVDDRFQLHGVYYDYNKPIIQERSYPVLDSLVAFLFTHPVNIEIRNHSDTRGSNRYSTCLTCKRSESIRQYLIEKGVAPERIVAKGYGEEEPLISDATIAKMETKLEQEEAHLTNRRSEVVVTGFLKPVEDE